MYILTVMQVSSAILHYYKKLAENRDMISKKHWEDLCVESIPSHYLQQNFKQVFETYTGGPMITMPWYAETSADTVRERLRDRQAC